ncbi:hypothetical protein [Nocardioides daphniae]|uniref:hypothetical protein n=1 Tax=Nocardioides daphniae TaxID=402297 RepID=UPI001EE8AAA5|nr:hypothetical protein [Nocardioides daphniae]
MRAGVALTVVAALVGLGATGVLAQEFLADRSASVTGQQVRAGAALPVTPQVSRPVAASRGGRGRLPQVDASWAARAAQATGIPVPAVTAYARATLAAPKRCELGWTTLAGIGWVESQHGTIGGRTLGRDGRSSSPILGRPSTAVRAWRRSAPRRRPPRCTATPPGTTPWGRCSSSRRPGAGSAATATATA